MFSFERTFPVTSQGPESEQRLINIPNIAPDLGVWKLESREEADELAKRERSGCRRGERGGMLCRRKGERRAFGCWMGNYVT